MVAAMAAEVEGLSWGQRGGAHGSAAAEDRVRQWAKRPPPHERRSLQENMGGGMNDYE